MFEFNFFSKELRTCLGYEFQDIINKHKQDKNINETKHKPDKH